MDFNVHFLWTLCTRENKRDSPCQNQDVWPGARLPTCAEHFTGSYLSISPPHLVLNKKAPKIWLVHLKGNKQVWFLALYLKDVVIAARLGALIHQTILQGQLSVQPVCLKMFNLMHTLSALTFTNYTNPSRVACFNQNASWMLFMVRVS